MARTWVLCFLAFSLTGGDSDELESFVRLEYMKESGSEFLKAVSGSEPEEAVGSGCDFVGGVLDASGLPEIGIPLEIFGAIFGGLFGSPGISNEEVVKEVGEQIHGLESSMQADFQQLQQTMLKGMNALSDQMRDVSRQMRAGFQSLGNAIADADQDIKNFITQENLRMETELYASVMAAFQSQIVLPLPSNPEQAFNALYNNWMSGVNQNMFSFLGRWKSVVASVMEDSTKYKYCKPFAAYWQNVVVAATAGILRNKYLAGKLLSGSDKNTVLAGLAQQLKLLREEYSPSVFGTCEVPPAAIWYFPGYTYRPAKCLDVSSDPKWGSIPQLWDCNGSPAQLFRWHGNSLRPLKDDRLCLVPTFPDNGNYVSLETCQDFSDVAYSNSIGDKIVQGYGDLHHDDAGWFVFNTFDGKAFADLLDPGSTANGNRMITRFLKDVEKHPHHVPQWDFHTKFFYTIDSPTGPFGASLDVFFDDKNTFLDADLYLVSGPANDAWSATGTRFWRRGFSIVNIASNKCIDLDNGVMKAGQRVRLWDCNDSPAQKWDVRDGLLRLRANPAYCLTVKRYATIDTCNTDPSQKMRFVPRSKGSGAGLTSGASTLTMIV